MEIRKIAVLGAGSMGHQLAQFFAVKGYQVGILATRQTSIEQAMAQIRANLDKYYVSKRKIDVLEAKEIISAINGTTNLEQAITGAQLVIESIPEDLELKKKIFKQLDELCSPEVILATNTSALSITSIASLATHQERIIGTHFFSPVATMKLIEVVRGSVTSEEVVEKIKELAKHLGKETIIIKDSPGFVTSRLLMTLVNEAAKLVYEGVATPEEIDKACELGMAHAMGPLKQIDFLSGVGIAATVCQYLRQELGETYRPCLLINQMAQTGQLGQKTGQGFYSYR